jgi:hypothetical protein
MEKEKAIEPLLTVADVADLLRVRPKRVYELPISSLSGRGHGELWVPTYSHTSKCCVSGTP